jgi:ParB/RepB/Spo0J family partition protein
MNAPTATIAQYNELPLAALAPSATHIQSLRRKHFDAQALQELAASFVDTGILQPLVVRPHPAPSARVKYEIVAGERRYQAASLIRLETVPVVVRALTDVQVLEIQLIENLQRAELTALEEAEGYRELMQAKAIKAEDLAPIVGKSRSWVYSRLNLLSLDGDARAALEDGRLDVSRALVVATVAQPNQRAEALKLALETGFNGKPTFSVRELRHKIVEEKLSMPLVGAPFDPADATLFPEAGDCAACPRRTGNCDPEALDPDVCTNLVCFHAKARAAGERKRAAVLEAGGKVLKGEDARKLSPSVNTVYGHVDLDQVCEHDEFPEKEPTPPKGVDPWDDEWEKNPAMIAWSEREKLWQPRTYRALLAGQKYKAVLIEDPKTHALRELLPFGEAQKLLKKAGITLPSHYNRKRPSGNGQAAGSKDTLAERQRNYAEEQRKEQAKRELEKKFRAKVLVAIADKCSGPLAREERVAVARDLTENHSVKVGLRAVYAKSLDIAGLSEANLGKLIRLALVADEVEWVHGEAKKLLALARRYKIDVDKIRTTAKREAEEKTPAAAKPAPAKKASKTAKKKSR